MIPGNHVQVKHLRKSIDIINKEIVVLKDGQNRNIRNDTQNQEELSPFALRLTNHQSSKVVDDDCKKEDEDVDGDKCRIKYTTRDQ